MTIPPGDRDSPSPPMTTPIPMASDTLIDERAELLAECRADLTDEERHMLSRQLAYRCRSFRRFHRS